MAERLLVGVVVGAHGLKGQVRIKSFTEAPQDLTLYGPLESDDGRRWRLQAVTVGAKGMVTAKVAGIDDRNGAEASRGVKLYVRRAALPAPDADEFYVADLVGLAAFGVDGEPLGVVREIYDFGAGDVVAIEGAAGEVLVPFTRRAVPTVDVAGGRVIVDPPTLTGGDEDDDGG